MYRKDGHYTEKKVYSESICIQQKTLAADLYIYLLGENKKHHLIIRQEVFLRSLENSLK